MRNTLLKPMYRLEKGASAWQMPQWRQANGSKTPDRMWHNFHLGTSAPLHLLHLANVKRIISSEPQTAGEIPKRKTI